MVYHYQNKTDKCATQKRTPSPIAVCHCSNLVGITRKDGAATEAMGLNPNLNIEDEYVENLLKQVHFLNLEIKLV
jgi:hypothetical protein